MIACPNCNSIHIETKICPEAITEVKCAPTYRCRGCGKVWLQKDHEKEMSYGRKIRSTM